MGGAIDAAADAQRSEAPRSLADTMARRLWQLDWSDHLPLCFDGVRVVLASFDDAIPFMDEHYASIFEVESRNARFLAGPMTAQKARFCREMDVFLFQDADRTVGVMMNHPLDWSTYYLRIAAFLPEYRGRNLSSRCLEAMYAPLRAAGVERVEAETAASNNLVVAILAGLGFVVTSTSNSERFGALIRFTKFLQEDAEAIFLRQFCAVSMQRATARKERRTS